MNYAENEVLEFIEENDVKFIRLAFCDIFGNGKNIAITSSELSRAFEYGISFDASSVCGFMNVEESDLLLFPDATTLAVLPWRPQQGRVARFYCEIRRPDGSVFDGDGRAFLKSAINKAKDSGYLCHVGTECEFYLFETDEKGNPTQKPFDNGGYCDVAPLDKGENVRREVCLTLEEMGLRPESSHHENGPGQNEIVFKYADPLTAADNFMTFKSVVKNVAMNSGLYATFMPKPLENASGNGLHINLSLIKNNENITTQIGNGYSNEAEGFIAGILNRIGEITLFLNQQTNSYKRLGENLAPRFITWSHQNRSPLIRIPVGENEYARAEVRSPDPACNPYIALGLLIYAGIQGQELKVKLPEPVNVNLYSLSEEETQIYRSLPVSLEEAISQAEKSKFLKDFLPNSILKSYLKYKLQESVRYTAASDKHLFEIENYFINS